MPRLEEDDAGIEPEPIRSEHGQNDSAENRICKDGGDIELAPILFDLVLFVKNPFHRDKESGKLGKI